MSKRFDNRTEDQFKEDIFFATAIENHFWDTWVSRCSDKDNIVIENPADNGVANDGSFIPSGINTAGADFKADLKYANLDQKDHPIEMKWVLTYGKVTLKQADIKAYLSEGSSILFIYPNRRIINLRKPRYPRRQDIANHIVKIESVYQNLRWGLLTPSKLAQLDSWARANKGYQSIPYMGGKSGIIIPFEKFSSYWTEEVW